MKTLTDEQAQAILAFHAAFDDCATGVWGLIETVMRDEHGVEDPEGTLEDALSVLR